MSLKKINGANAYFVSYTDTKEHTSWTVSLLIFSQILLRISETTKRANIVALLINRAGVAGAFLQTALSLIHSLINSVRDPFPPNLQNIKTPRPLELDS